MTPDSALQMLGLEPGATKAQIRQAYRDLAKVWHPDRFQDDPRLRAKAEATFQQVNAAYEALKSRPGVRSASASGHKPRSRARPAQAAAPNPRPEEDPPPPPHATPPRTPPSRTPPPDPRSTHRAEPRVRPVPPSSTPRIIVAGIVIWGIGVLFGVLLGLTLLSQACSEPSPRW